MDNHRQQVASRLHQEYVTYVERAECWNRVRGWGLYLVKHPAEALVALAKKSPLPELWMQPPIDEVKYLSKRIERTFGRMPD